MCVCAGMRRKQVNRRHKKGILKDHMFLKMPTILLFVTLITMTQLTVT